MIFLFEHAYPSAARCVIAVGGTCEPSWSEVQATLAAECNSLDQHLLLAEEADYGENDPLLRLARSGAIVIPQEYFLQHDLLNELFSANARTNLRYLIEDGVVPFATDDPWIGSIATIRELFPERSYASQHFLVPFICAETRERGGTAEKQYKPLGFVLVDSPYTHWVEHTNHTALTRLVCDLFAPYIEARSLVSLRQDPYMDRSTHTKEHSRGPSAIEILPASDLERLCRSTPARILQQFEESYRNLGDDLQVALYKVSTTDRPPEHVKGMLAELARRIRAGHAQSVGALDENAREVES
jgi:hypothetical protein